MKTFVIGDIHGAYKALLQCLKLSKFDRKQDRLICLGDVCDRGKQVKESIDELLTIPHCVYILGNHDWWALKWAVEGQIPEVWPEQGGASTIASYGRKGMPEAHIRFLKESPDYFIEQNKLFVHGGFDTEVTIEKNPQETLLWDRELLMKACELQPADPEHKFGGYDEIYIGHTPTLKFEKQVPLKFCNVWDMDTGAGWGAKLTIMDVETKEFWQSNVS